MAEWVEKGSIKGPPGEIPDVSDFLRDSDVSQSISEATGEKVASDKAVKDYVDSNVVTYENATAEQSGLMSAEDKEKLDGIEAVPSISIVSWTSEDIQSAAE